MTQAFRALLVTEAGAEYHRALVERNVEDLPPGELLVRVHWSALNYKDALSATGNKGVTRKYPHTPGIDAGGIVAQSAAPDFPVGARVIVTSHDLGMNTPGGWGEYIRVPAAWAVPLPAGLDLREAMILGTGGLTAALSVLRLEALGLAPSDGEVLVTGATGGVGCLAVAMLARAGYRVAAVTGKPEAGEWLRGLGAQEILAREAIDDGGPRPLLKGRWAGVVDTVGGAPLAAVLKSVRYGGIVTCCGLVAAPELHTTVFPFILRGVSLNGIDSAECPMPLRRMAWARMAGPWKPAALEALAREVALDALEPEIAAILDGRQRGRVVVRLGDVR